MKRHDMGLGSPESRSPLLIKRVVRHGPSTDMTSNSVHIIYPRRRRYIPHYYFLAHSWCDTGLCVCVCVGFVFADARVCARKKCQEQWWQISWYTQSGTRGDGTLAAGGAWKNRSAECVCSWNSDAAVEKVDRTLHVALSGSSSPPPPDILPRRRAGFCQFVSSVAYVGGITYYRKWLVLTDWLTDCSSPSRNRQRNAIRVEDPQWHFQKFSMVVGIGFAG